MDIKTLEERLSIFDGEIQNILEEAGYNKRSFELTNLEYDNEDMNDIMMYKEFCSMCSHLDYIHSVFHYLQKPVTQVGEIHVNNNGNYELGGTILDNDDVVEIISMDEEDKKPYWYPLLVSTRKNLDGETARIRG